MFFAALARSHVSPSPAERNNKNRPKGTLVTKPMDVVNKEEIQKTILQNLIHAIRENWLEVCVKA